MSIRTAEQLDDALAEDLIWRKKELSALKLLTEGAPPERQPTLLRASVAMLYAHWEGFVKSTSGAYVELVAFQRLKYRELSPHFLALAIRKLLRAASESRRIAAHLTVTRFFLSDLDTQSSIPYKEAVRTEANLSSRVLREIIDTLGLDYSPYETKAQLIDEVLLRSRNTIAHGEFLPVDLSRYRQLHEEVVGMLDTFRNQVSNAAALREYKRIAA